MKDILGRELQENQLVFIINDDTLLLTKVIGFTNTLVILDQPPYKGLDMKGKKAPHKLIIANKEEVERWIEESYPTEHFSNHEKKNGYLNWLNEFDN